VSGVIRSYSWYARRESRSAAPFSRPRDRGRSLVASPADSADTVHKSPFNQPLDESALAAQSPLQASHPAIIVLVIIAKKVQQAMQGQHPQLDRQRMAGLTGLTGRNSRSYHDIAEFAGLPGAERQHVRYPVFTAVTVIQRADTGVWNDRHGHLAARP
jgi:hypothetical protein